MDSVRVLIIGADPLARAGLAAMLADHPECEVVAQISEGVDLEENVEIYRPDVILWDVGWQVEISIKYLQQFAPEDPPILVMLPAETHPKEVWSAAVRGLLLRREKAERVIQALRSVAEGFIILDPLFGSRLLQAANEPGLTLVHDLTPRELEVLRLVAEGLTNRAIARQLTISEHTVKFHLNSIMSKLNAQSRTEAVVLATRAGLILL